MFPTAEGYVIDALAGIGGMGAVYRATERATGATVALKVLESRHGGDVDEARFRREVELLASVEHPAIVRYLGEGRTEGGQPYLAMEWIEGLDLARRIADGPLSPLDAVRIARRVAGGLAALHARGVLHRDVKPSNVMLVGERPSDAKLLDLGIAKRADWTRFTNTGAAIGTPGYMAPEQARGDPDLDARVDVFALGCVFFECLTGRPAFPGEHVVAILARVLLEDAPPPSVFRAGLSPAIDALVQKLLAKQKEARFADASEVEAALAAIPESDLGGRAASIRPPASLRIVTEAERRVVSVVVARLPARTLSNDEGRAVEGITHVRGGSAALLADGSMLLSFGGDGAATDRAAQAALAALRLREELEGVPIAIATGRVIVESSATSRPLGEAIDAIAKRLHRDARIIVDRTTAELLGDRFELRDASGETELLGARAHGIAPRKLLGKPTPCVGRERELGVLRGLLDESAADGVARAAVILGPAGIGKSRLLYEFIRVAESRDDPPEVWLARGEEVGKNSAFGLIASAIRGAAGVFEGEPPLLKQAKIAAFVKQKAAGADEAKVTAALATLLGAPLSTSPASVDPIVAGDRLRAAIEELFAAVARRPLVLVIEDLHWGDVASVNALDAVLRRLREAPLVVVAFARPEALAQFPKLWAGRGATELWIGELTRRACERLIREVLGARPKEEIDRLIAHAAGNAFYLEELIRAAATSGASEVPGTVIAMMEARLAAISIEARRTLRAASVFGEAFWRGGLLRALGGERRAPEIDLALDELESMELVERRGSSRFPAETELTFRHALVRDVAYGMLTEEDRAIAHRHAARWLEEVGEHDPTKLAEHFERAGENDRAVSWLVTVAAQALEGNDIAGAIAAAARVAELGAEGETLGRAKSLSAEAHRWSGRHAEGLADAREAMRLLPKDSAAWWTAATSAAIFLGRTNQFEEARAFGEELLHNAAPASVAGARATALARSAVVLMHAGQPAASDRLLAALDEAEADIADDLRARAFVLTARAQRAQAAGDPSGLGGYEEATRLLREAGDLRTACDTSIGAASGWNELGRYDRAEAVLVPMLRDSGAMGLVNTQMAGATNLALAYLEVGRADEAEPLLQQAIEVMGSGANARAEAWCRAYYARMLRVVGRYDAAEREALRATEVGHAAAPVVAYALAELARTLLARGHIEDALAPARRALGMLDAVEEGESSIRRAAVEALRGNGEAGEADELLRASAARVRERGASITDAAVRQSFFENVADNRWLLDEAAAL